MGTMCTVNNKLIAEFMGFIECNKNTYQCCFGKINRVLPPQYMEFNTDWNWLMEVVERINNTGRFEVVIQKGFCYVSDESNELTLSCPASNTLEAVYQAVVEFIKWYNN